MRRSLYFTFSSSGLTAAGPNGPHQLFINRLYSDQTQPVQPPKPHPHPQTKLDPPTPLQTLRGHLFSTLHPLQIALSHHLHSQKKLLAQMPSKLSKLTGYGDIEKLKMLVAAKEADLRTSRSQAAEMKTRFAQAAAQRAASVREVNDLLARKAGWSDEDLARFTTLVRTDHSNEQEELNAKRLLEQAEATVDLEFTALMQAILSRYHEEQIWSDKIRSLSTSFSLSITLINLLVFLAAIVLVEPYKRSKVVEAVESRMVARDGGRSEILDRSFREVSERLERSEMLLASLVERAESASTQVQYQQSVEPESVQVQVTQPLEQANSGWVSQPASEDQTAEVGSVKEEEEALAECCEGSSLSEEDPHPAHPKDQLTGWSAFYNELVTDRRRELELGAAGLSAVILMGLFQLYSR